MTKLLLPSNYLGVAPKQKIMSAISRPKLSAAEYLQAERLADHKSEFFRGEVFAMAGGSREHSRIKENLVGE